MTDRSSMAATRRDCPECGKHEDYLMDDESWICHACGHVTFKAAWWRCLLREIVVTLDVLLGGDHRRRGHEPPAYVTAPTKPPPKPRDT